MGFQIQNSLLSTLELCITKIVNETINAFDMYCFSMYVLIYLCSLHRFEGVSVGEAAAAFVAANEAHAWASHVENVRHCPSNSDLYVCAAHIIVTIINFGRN